MADVSDPALQESYNQLVASKDETNYILWELDGGKVSVKTIGTTGLDGLRGELADATDKVLFGALLVTGVDERKNVTSRRPKFVNITFIGENVSVLKKAKVSVQRRPVLDLMNGSAVSLNVSHVEEDLEEKAIGAALLKAGAAHKPTHYDFGAGNVKTLEELGL